jgi:hypothetical protein
MNPEQARVQVQRLLDGSWQHGEDGYWDRISALLGYVKAQGGLGSPRDTRAQLDLRRKHAEIAMIGWARADANDFASYAYSSTATGLPLQQSRMHFLMQRAFDVLGNADVGAYRGSGKTSQMIEVRGVHTLGTDPNLQLKLVCEGGDTASARVRAIRNHIERNARIRMVFPKLLPMVGMPWSDESITVARETISKDPSFFGAGFNSAVVGGRCHILLGDDVTPPDAMSSSSTRAAVERSWENVWTKMLTPGGRIWFAYTPWHDRDLTAKIRANAAFRHLLFAVGGPQGCQHCPDNKGDPCGIPFHNPWAPQLHSAEELCRIYLRDGSLSYSRSHQLIPLVAETSLFPPSLFTSAVRRTDLIMGRPWRWWASYGIRRVIGVDLAMGAGAGDDYTVICVLGFDENGKRYLIDLIREKTTDYQRQLQLVKEAYSKYLPDMIFAEGTQYQRVFSSILAATTALPIKAFYPMGAGKGRRVEGADKRDLKFGVPGLRILFEQSKLILPIGDDYSLERSDILQDELQHIAMTDDGKVEGVGSHDDCVMALYIAHQAALRLGADFGEEVDRTFDGSPLPGNLEGLEDSLPVSSVPLQHPDLGKLIPLAAGAGQAVQVPVKRIRPRPAEYEEIYQVLRDQEPRHLDAYVRYVAALHETPKRYQLLGSGFPPALAGKLDGLQIKFGGASVLLVAEDLSKQFERAVLVGDRRQLDHVDEARVEELFGEGDEGLAAQSLRLPEGAEGWEVL